MSEKWKRRLIALALTVSVLAILFGLGYWFYESQPA